MREEKAKKLRSASVFGNNHSMTVFTALTFLTQECFYIMLKLNWETH